MGCALAGCGVTQAEYNQRTTDVEKCQAELAHTQVELGAATGRLADRKHDLEQRDEQIATLEGNARTLSKNLSATEREMDALRKAHAQAEQRSELYRTLVARLRDAIGAGTLSVDVRKGKMLVHLGDAILFDPGQTALKTAGQTALRQVALALKEIPDRDFVVAGHTDNKPIKSSPFAGNWELSTARAVTVVRFLQAEGVDPRHLAAAGYSEFDALGDNDDPAERARNRRIEIVVMPRIDELPAIDITDPAAPDRTTDTTTAPPTTTTAPGTSAPASPTVAPPAPATGSPAPPAPPTP
ncbi:MAG TPA: OmpA family protein [Polyangia bacterium]|jgi:chemotaxis protein MotB|nr:OmpA family protein [Polyangia bacterium]